MGEETYEAEGKTIKTARQNAAKIALEHTKYEQPPLRVKPVEDTLPNTPTVQLNNIAAQLALKVEYNLMDKASLEEVSEY